MRPGLDPHIYESVAVHLDPEKGGAAHQIVVLDFTKWLVPKEAAHDQSDLEAATEALKEGPPIPYEQIRQGLGLDKYARVKN